MVSGLVVFGFMLIALGVIFLTFVILVDTIKPMTYPSFSKRSEIGWCILFSGIILISITLFVAGLIAIIEALL